MVHMDLRKALNSNWVVVISMLGVTHELWELNVKDWDFTYRWKGVSIILRVNIISHYHLNLNLVSHTHKSCALEDLY